MLEERQKKSAISKSSEQDESEKQFEIVGDDHDLKSMPDAHEMIEMHLSETLKAGPITKFNGVNVIKMLGDDLRLFFGEKPKAMIVTFFVINIPTTFFNIMIAGVSQVLMLTTHFA